MIPAMPVFPGYDSYHVEQLKRQDTATRAFAKTVGVLLSDLFPGHGKRIDDVTDAWIAMQCCGTEEQIEQLEAHRAYAAAHPFPTHLSFEAKSEVDQLCELITERDKKTDAIERARRGAEAFPVDGMEDLIESTIVAPLERDLEFTEARISQLQKSIERANAVTSPPAEPAESSANTSGAD